MTHKSKVDRITPPDATLEDTPGPTEGFIRPDVTVLPGQALISAGNLIVPAPNQFTHELARAQPFYFADPEQGIEPAGEFPAATQVVLLVYEGGTYCRVVDSQGLYVEIEYDNLKKL